MENLRLTEEMLEKLINLANALEEVNTKENGDLYIKFKKDVIIENGGNFALISDGFNIQIADQIHFNPEFELETFKQIIKENFTEAKYKIIEQTAQLLNKELTRDEIEAILDGKPINEFGNFDLEKIKKLKETKPCKKHKK